MMARLLLRHWLLRGLLAAIPLAACAADKLLVVHKLDDSFGFY